MLAIVIYVVAAVAVVVIGLVTVGREAFRSSRTLRHVTFELSEMAEFVAEGLDDRTAGRLTPDDVLWILRVDAELLEATAGTPENPGAGVLDDDAAVAAVMARLDGPRAEVVDADDVAAVLAARSRYLEAIGAFGPPAEAVEDGGTP